MKSCAREGEALRTLTKITATTIVPEILAACIRVLLASTGFAYSDSLRRVRHEPLPTFGNARVVIELLLRPASPAGYYLPRGRKSSLRPRRPNLDLPTDSCLQAELISNPHRQLPRDGFGLLRESRERLAHVGALGAVVLSVLAAAGLLAGCDAGDVARPMMPAPIIMKDP